MDRKNFLKNCSMACMSGMGMLILMPGCANTKSLTGNIVADDLVIPLGDFEIKNGNETFYKKYLVVNNDLLQYPICVYRFNEKEYSALWMRCTHQGTELQVFGDKLQCPAHGSEFNNRGMVQNGPADNMLRTFAVKIENNQLKISLKAV